MKPILTGLQMYAYWPGPVFIGRLRCVRVRAVCPCVWCVCVVHICDACAWCVCVCVVGVRVCGRSVWCVCVARVYGAGECVCACVRMCMYI